MDVKTNPLVLEANIIYKKGGKFKFPEYKIILHTKDKDIYLEHVTEIIETRDFINNVADLRFLSFMIPLGMYRDIIEKQKNHLEVTITVNKDGKTDTKRYKFVPTVKLDNIAKSSSTNKNPSELDTQDMKEVTGQCIDPEVLKLKTIYVDGVYHGYKIPELLKLIFAREGYPITYVYDKIANEYDENIIIESYTKLIKVPYYIHKNYGGIYDGGVGVYLTETKIDEILEPIIWVYPKYNFKRYSDADDKVPKLNVINPPQFGMDVNDLDKYYRKGFYEIIASDVEVDDKLYTGVYNKSSLFISGDIRKITMLPTMCKKDKEMMFYYDPSEVIGYKRIREGISGFDSLSFLGITTDVPLIMSEQNKLKAIILNVKFNNMFVDFIIPGMPVRYYYTYQGEVRFTDGVVVGVNNVVNIKKASTYGSIVLAVDGDMLTIKHKEEDK